MPMLFAYFEGLPGCPAEQTARAIFEAHDGRSIGSGTILIGPNAGTRDIQYELSDERVDDCRTVLRRAGFRTS